MAISDTLSDAVIEMRRMLDSQPSMYAEVKQQMEALITAMDGMRAILDTPPFDPTGPQASVYEALTCDRQEAFRCASESLYQATSTATRAVVPGIGKL